jgi:hypothetical protein
MSDTVFALMKRRIDEMKSDLEKFLANGSAKSMEEYNRIVGRYEALSIIQNELADLEKRYIES